MATTLMKTKFGGSPFSLQTNKAKNQFWTLHCYVIVELKAGSFDPRDAGQMNFYLSAVDDMLRSLQDNPSIGLLLCKDKKGLKVEYALRDIHKPLGVAEYETKIIESLPENLKGSLPSIEEIEKELE